MEALGSAAGCTGSAGILLSVDMASGKECKGEHNRPPKESHCRQTSDRSAKGQAAVFQWKSR